MTIRHGFCFSMVTFTFAVALIASVCGPPALGQSLAGEYYGLGVNAFFDGRTGEAVSHFDNAISLEPNEPHYYYFRGLAQYCGCSGNGDFLTGATIEASTGSGRPSSRVNRALERVQGPVRLEIEKYRREARLGAELQQRYQARPPSRSMSAPVSPRVMPRRPVVPELPDPRDNKPMEADVEPNQERMGTPEPDADTPEPDDSPFGAETSPEPDSPTVDLPFGAADEDDDAGDSPFN